MNLIAEGTDGGKEIGPHALAASAYDSGRNSGLTTKRSGADMSGYIFVLSVELGRYLESSDIRRDISGRLGRWK